MCHVSRVMCHVSCVICLVSCHESYVTCHVSCVPEEVIEMLMTDDSRMSTLVDNVRGEGLLGLFVEVTRLQLTESYSEHAGTIALVFPHY